jgi:hypothetical protein
VETVVETVVEEAAAGDGRTVDVAGEAAGGGRETMAVDPATAQ